MVLFQFLQKTAFVTGSRLKSGNKSVKNKKLERLPAGHKKKSMGKSVFAWAARRGLVK
ncbi:MAG: hypothetical protein IJM69_09735 [Firmicutes bacterium]|nr:hypothetical protein [Bacillota bacterium]